MANNTFLSLHLVSTPAWLNLGWQSSRWLSRNDVSLPLVQLDLPPYYQSMLRHLSHPHGQLFTRLQKHPTNTVFTYCPSLSSNKYGRCNHFLEKVTNGGMVLVGVPVSKIVRKIMCLGHRDCSELDGERWECSSSKMTGIEGFWECVMRECWQTAKIGVLNFGRILCKYILPIPWIHPHLLASNDKTSDLRDVFVSATEDPCCY